MRRAQVEDWLDDLAEFSPEVVVEACVRWRRQPGGRRPTPGDIRTYCIEEQKRHQENVVALEGPESRGGRLVDEEAYSRSAGWSSALERRDAIVAAKQRELCGDCNHPERGESATIVPGFKSVAAALGVKAEEIIPHHLVDEDDPRVQARLRDMEAAQ